MYEHSPSSHSTLSCLVVCREPLETVVFLVWVVLREALETPVALESLAFLVPE